LIVLGLQGIALSALLHGVLPGAGGRGDRRIRALRPRLGPGGVVMLVCGSVALIGFPLDAIWHALFGEDVTLWGPTHLLMIGGAGVSTLGLWMIVRQGLEVGRPRRIARRVHARVTGALLVGLSTFQAEFDFGVPQFQLLFQPALIALAAGCALVCARSLLGRWGAFRALGMFLAIRGALALFVGVVAGYTTPHFPLYVAEAAVVELTALVFARRPLQFALAAGAGVGTVGFAAEWAWSHVWMTHPWPASMLASAAPLALVAGLAGAVLGARISQSLALEGSERAGLAPIRAPAVAAAGAALLVALAIPLPCTDGDGTRAAIGPRPAGPGAARLSVALDPPRAARGAQWFEVLAWQGRTPGRTADRAPARDRARPFRRRSPGARRRQLEVDGAPRAWIAPHGHAGLPAAVAAGRPGGRPGRSAVRRDARRHVPPAARGDRRTGMARGGRVRRCRGGGRCVARARGVGARLAEPPRAVRESTSLRRAWPPPAAPV
jgi:hypothetical protein